jgi:hypothetical protein
MNSSRAGRLSGNATPLRRRFPTTAAAVGRVRLLDRLEAGFKANRMVRDYVRTYQIPLTGARRSPAALLAAE